MAQKDKCVRHELCVQCGAFLSSFEPRKVSVSSAIMWLLNKRQARVLRMVHSGMHPTGLSVLPPHQPHCGLSANPAWLLNRSRANPKIEKQKYCVTGRHHLERYPARQPNRYHPTPRRLLFLRGVDCLWGGEIVWAGECSIAIAQHVDDGPHHVHHGHRRGL